MFLVTGDITSPKLHSTWDKAIADIVERCKTLPRWKHPRHGRKRWTLHYLNLDGESEYLGMALSFIESGYMEIPTQGKPYHRTRMELSA